MISGWIERIAAYLSDGGFAVMGTLTVAAAIMWYALGYRMLILRRGSIRDVRKIVEQRRVGESSEPKGVLDTAAALGVNLTRHSANRLRQRLDEAFGPFEDDISRYSTLVKSIVAVSPLLGLLGTVMGMIETFDSLADMSLFSQSGGIAGGISQALFTTQMGLAVALPGLVAGRVLDRRQALISDELAEIKDILCIGEAPAKG